LAWTLEISDLARKQFRKLDSRLADRITRGMADIAALENPRLRGKAMAGNLAGYWRYRFGDYRVIARIEDDRLVIVVLSLGHRREAYR